MLVAARREVGRRAAAGRDDASLELEALGAALEADPADREVLAAAEMARRRTEFFEAGPPSGPRALRARRAAEVSWAVGELLLAGELIADGPGRVRLPGFGGATWRSIAVLRAGDAGPERLLAAAVAAEPSADLGPSAPAFLTGLTADPRLVGAARRLHALEAARQDARDALLRAAAALVSAVEAGHRDSAQLLRTDCAALEARIATLDAALEAGWAEGVRRAASLPG